MVVRKTLSQQVVEELIEKIDKEYKPGDKIPNEMELAEELQVSRTTIREAIKRLCSENYLEIRRGRGTFVCEHPGMDGDPLGYSTIDRETLYDDMLEVTLNLEPVLARLAAEKSQEEHVAKLQEINRQFEAKLQAYRSGEDTDVQQFRILDLKFHKAMINGCCNQIVDRTIYAFLSDAVEWGEVWNRIDHEKVLLSCEHYHPLITESIAAHDADKTFDLAQKHTKEIIDIYRQSY